METKQHKSKRIEKIKMSDEGTTIHWTETIMTETYNDANELQSEDKNFIHHAPESDFRPHKDFMDAMKMLRKPVIDICELGDYKHFDKYRIYGVSFSGEQDEAKVIISFGKEVDWSGLVFNSNTPLTPLYDQDKFQGAAQLDKFCAAILREAWLYIDGKHAENPQLSLSFADGSHNNLPLQN